MWPVFMTPRLPVSGSADLRGRGTSVPCRNGCTFCGAINDIKKTLEENAAVPFLNHLEAPHTQTKPPPFFGISNYTSASMLLIDSQSVHLHLHLHR
jgi:uncharacterized Fe-S cluster-containing MiaB family protein